jgi:hypothetical protein
MRDAGVVRIHLDTDLGGDTDDACALAMLLGWPGVELTGITTTCDAGGRRAGYVAYCLAGAVVADVPVTAVRVGELLLFRRDPNGRPTHVVVDFDASRFPETWLRAVQAATSQRR